MIYLCRTGMLFIKTRKTAGTSVEIALSANAEDGDIITPISPKYERLRLPSPFRNAMNWAIDPSREADYWRWFAAYEATKRGADFDLGERPRPSARFFSHMSAAAIRDRLGPDRFDAAHKVTIVRHPYTQLLSRAHWESRHGRLSVSEAIDYFLDQPAENAPNCLIDGQSVIDTYLRFERLREDLACLEQRFGYTILEHLPLTKRSTQPLNVSVSDYLSASQKRRCQERNRWEFDQFGYAV